MTIAAGAVDGDFTGCRTARRPRGASRGAGVSPFTPRSRKVAATHHSLAETAAIAPHQNCAALGVVGHTTAAGRAVAREMWQVRPRQHDARSFFSSKFSVSIESVAGSGNEGSSDGCVPILLLGVQTSTISRGLMPQGASMPPTSIMSSRQMTILQLRLGLLKHWRDFDRVARGRQFLLHRFLIMGISRISAGASCSWSGQSRRLPTGA